MKDYVALRDRLICGKNDEIDNAAFKVVSAVVMGKEEAELMSAVTELMAAMIPSDGRISTITKKNGTEGSHDLLDIKEISEAMRHIISEFGIPELEEGEEPEWDMMFIEDIVETMESEFCKKNMGYCHPFFTFDEDTDESTENYDEENGGVLCCLSCDRCEWCKEPENMPVSSYAKTSNSLNSI